MSEYAKSGVDHHRKDAGLSAMVEHLRGTFGNHPEAVVRDELGYYASVLEIPGERLAIAMGTDSVGTKVLVAQRAGRHDTVGIDCVAMNANDVICVGADPIAMVDYIGVNFVDPDVVEALGRGLAEGARRAEISIPGGELAQVRDLVRGHGDGCHYDLIGTCVGVADRERLSDGSAVAPGDVVLGIASTGLHSNGFSLARRVIFETLGRDVNDRLEECGRSVADELLEPTGMYVKECKALQRAGIPVRAYLNITGGGFSNLLRVAAPGVGFRIDALPEPPPIFRLLQEAGKVSDAEMHGVFNMGVGFCVVVPAERADEAAGVAASDGKATRIVGAVVADDAKRCVVVREGSAGCLVAGKAKDAFRSVESVPAEYRS